jgi:type VI secretion system secreted protein Hcp
MFIKIADVEGESKDKNGHTGEIDVLAWSWGVSNSGSAHTGGGQGAGKANVQDLSFTKYIDKASAPLQLAVLNGKHYATADLVVRKAGEKPLEYLKIILTDLIVTSVSTGGSGGEDRLTENVSLNFAKVKMEYYAQDEKGVGKKVGTYTYDIAGNLTE